jgi:hypothetical protein
LSEKTFLEEKLMQRGRVERDKPGKRVFVRRFCRLMHLWLTLLAARTGTICTQLRGDEEMSESW